MIAWTDQFCTCKTESICSVIAHVSKSVEVSASLPLFLVGGHGGISDFDRRRPEGAGH